MPKDSNRKRHLRRVKRERTLAFRMVEHLQNERDMSRQIIQGMAKHIDGMTEHIETLTPKQTVEDVKQTEVIADGESI